MPRGQEMFKSLFTGVDNLDNPGHTPNKSTGSWAPPPNILKPRGTNLIMSSIRNSTWSGFGMTEDPRVQSGSNNGASAGNHEPSGQATQFFSDSSNLTQVAQTLAAHGGGAVSVELALDLVLNEVVEQARAATGATGAAVALFRDGELTCRATAGENAPD